MMNRMMRQMMREAMQNAMQNATKGANQQSVTNQVHAAGMRKARLAAAQQRKDGTGDNQMGQENQVTPEQRKNMLRCAAFVGLCLSASLSLRQDRYKFEVQAVAKTIKALWEDLASMPQKARDQVFSALRMSLGEKGMPILQEVFSAAGIQIGTEKPIDDEEL